MNILVAAAEVAPFAKVGGLADMTGTLPRAWEEAGHDVRVVLPLYGTIDKDAYGITKMDLVLEVPMGRWPEFAQVWTAIIPGTKTPLYFLSSSDYYDRPGIYGYHDGFPDNDRRFIFLSRAAFELARALNYKPDIVHAHDYHTALCMPMLKIHYAGDPFFSGTAGVFSIHNMAYQGMYDPMRAMELCGFDPRSFHIGSWFEQDGIFNCLKAGIMFADKITTVSPTYAQEIRWTPEGMGLQSALQARGTDLIGILNGIDTNEWNPATDAYTPVPYDADTLDKKEINKRALLQDMGLNADSQADGLPLVGMVSRLTEQKGISLLPHCLERFVAERRMRLVILGSGENRFEDYFLGLRHRHPEHVFVGTGYNNPLSHRIQAASDFYLMPSRFEPCGLTQMFALAYGSIPIVRAVGGLADTITQYDPITFYGNGFRFNRYSAEACSEAIEQALRVYRREPHWTQLRRNAMASKYAIDDTARHYLEVFTWARERFA